MVFRGHIENGCVVLDEPATLANGLQVEVRVVDSIPGPNGKARRPWLDFAGKVNDLPPDASVTIDQVLYGRPPE